jgi:hypothetical protein
MTGGYRTVASWIWREAHGLVADEIYEVSEGA